MKVNSASVDKGLRVATGTEVSLAHVLVRYAGNTTSLSEPRA